MLINSSKPFMLNSMMTSTNENEKITFDLCGIGRSFCGRARTTPPYHFRPLMTAQFHTDLSLGIVVHECSYIFTVYAQR